MSLVSVRLHNSPQVTCWVAAETLWSLLGVFTPIDPYVLANQLATNIAFVMQLAPYIRKKVHKLEGFEGMKRSQLLEVAQSL